MGTSCAGFTLIECMLYLTLSSVLIGYVSSYFFHAYRQAQVSERQCRALINEWMINQRFTNDVRQALAAQQSWDFPSSSCIMRIPEGDVGWMLHEEKLIRCHGSYDYEKHQWIQSKKVTFTSSVKNITFSPTIMQAQVRGVSMTYSYDGKIFQRQVSTNNGRVG